MVSFILAAPVHGLSDPTVSATLLLQADSSVYDTVAFRLAVVLTIAGLIGLVYGSRVRAIRRHNTALQEEIRERQRIEEALRREKDYIAQVIATAPVIACGVSPGGEIRWTNPAAERISGRPQKGLAGRSWSAVFCQEYSEAVPTASTGSSDSWPRVGVRPGGGDDFPGPNQESTFRDAEGRDKVISWNAAKRFGELGEVVEVILIGVDVSESKLMDEQRRQSQRLEALGQLAGGVAHDFNNILTSMMGFSALAEDRLAPGSDERSYLEEINKAGDRARGLVSQILAFSRRNSAVKERVDIAGVVSEALGLLRASLPAGVQIQERLDDGCGDVMADPTQLHQVVMNLATNAYQAVKPGSGILRVELSRAQIDPGGVLGMAPLPVGDYARLRVTDNGSGVPASAREHIFEPFFTTKPVGKGSGLGLSVVHGIVRNHGGRIFLERTSSEGSTFCVYWPLAEAEDARRPAAEPPRGDLSLGLPTPARVLMIDDEESILKLGGKMLVKFGCEAVTANSAEAGLARFSEDPDRIDLVITDLTMPKMNGVQLAHQLHDIRDTIPIVLCTGYGEDAVVEAAKHAGIQYFLNKPFTAPELLQTIRQALGTEARAAAARLGGRE